MEIPPDAIEQLLDSWRVARLATSSETGPHIVPVVYARARGRIWSPVDGKPKAGGELARVRHVEERPRVSLLLDHYEHDWTRLWWVRVDGEAEVVREAEPEAVRALQAKYPQYEEIPVLQEPPVLIAIEPRRVVSWCAGPEALDFS